MTYRNNRKAWMLATIFQEWLQDFSKEVAKRHENQRVLLLLDNCPSHKAAGIMLSNIDLYFLPPNTTAKIQPMDAGIISSFKRHYRSLHVRWLLSEIRKGNDIKDLKMDVLQAINYIIRSWEEITPLTISNCWKHTKILPTNINAESTEILNTNSVPTSGELAQAVNDLNLPDSLPIDEFLNYPEEGRIYEVSDSNTFIEELIEIYKPCIDDGDIDGGDIDDSVEPPIVHASDAANGLEIVRSFLQQQQDSKELLKHVRVLEHYISLKSVSEMKQTMIDKFFDNIE